MATGVFPPTPTYFADYILGLSSDSLMSLKPVSRSIGAHLAFPINNDNPPWNLGFEITAFSFFFNVSCFWILYWIHPFKSLLFSFTELIRQVLLMKERNFKINKQILGLSNKGVKNLNMQICSVVFWWDCVWGPCRLCIQYLQLLTCLCASDWRKYVTLLMGNETVV